MGDAAAAAAASRDLDDAIVREPPTVDKIRESFEGARLAARGFRRRVLLPMRVTGAVLGILGILVSAGVRGYGYGMLFAISGSAMLLFSLLPTDYRAIQCTAYLSITTMLAAALISSLYAASVAAELVSANAAGECTDNNCPFVIVLFVGAALAAICCLGLAGQLVFVLGRPRACRLHRLFKSMSKFYFVIGAELFAALVLCELAPAKYAQRLLPQLATQQYGLACAFCAAVATGLLLRCPRCRARMQSWLVQHDEAISAAAGIAALFDNRSSREVQERAAVTFRFITLDMLSEADLLPGVPGSDLFARSRQATFGGVDAFVSHSWHDDPAQKWAALREWGDAFVLAHGREPRLWVDRACCDQSAIGEAIRCLPLYLAGCSTLLVLQGENTLRRLWCVVELYIFLEMGSDMSRIQCVALEPAVDALLPAAGEEAKMSALLSFDVKEAECTKATDRDRLMMMIEAGGGGTDGFNVRLREALVKINVRAAAAALRSSTRISRAVLRSAGSIETSPSAQSATPTRRASEGLHARSLPGTPSGRGSVIGVGSPSRRRRWLSNLSPSVSSRSSPGEGVHGPYVLPGCKRHRASGAQIRPLFLGVPDDENSEEKTAALPESIRLAQVSASTPFRGAAGPPAAAPVVEDHEFNNCPPVAAPAPAAGISSPPMNPPPRPRSDSPPSPDRGSDHLGVGFETLRLAGRISHGNRDGPSRSLRSPSSPGLPPSAANDSAV
mmetsp:Transcript_3489/g.8719  ORF Transcript_3489/g.8719 Transcript_3489/m.8719 type:complete len:729 (-) Transcript_3489:70-2256(-)